MNNFSYTRALDVPSAVREVAASHEAVFIAGGTNLIDLMKENVSRPSRLVDITRLPLNRIEELQDGGLRLGALVTNADTAYNEQVERRYPILSRAILAGASPQLRNMATDGGNLLQRTRCYYFYDTATPCNKRDPGAGCSAIDGFNRIHAILGTSDQCIAMHPSDMCVALAALEAVVQVTGTARRSHDSLRRVPSPAGDTPQIDTNLGPEEIITSIDLPREGVCRSPRLSEGARSDVVCLRARVRRRGARDGRRHDHGRHVSRLEASRTSRGAIWTPKPC